MAYELHSISGMNAKPAKTYLIKWSTRVDRPELRDGTFAPSAPHYVPMQRTVSSLRAAVSMFGELTNGQSDFASEYVCSATVTREHPGRGKGYTMIRRTHRTRAADGSVQTDAE